MTMPNHEPDGFRVLASPRVEHFLSRLDTHLRQRIRDRLKRLRQNPIPSDARFIGRRPNGHRVFRYRIGDYWALYEVIDQDRVVLLIKIDKRSRVYRR